MFWFRTIVVIIVFTAFFRWHKKQKMVGLQAPGGRYYTLFSDILSQPHTLIAGATGSGKSVAMNGLIHTLLFRLPTDSPNGALMIMIDPKRVELARYRHLPHVIEYASGQDPDAWLRALNRAVKIMDKRYTKMERNRLLDYDGGDLYVFIDEWASINSRTNSRRTECVAALLRLVSEGRAAKVHVIMATQVPKATVIPTEIRDNFTARLALMTENKMQSRVIIDEAGCEEFPSPRLAGYACGMYCLPGNQRTVYEIPYVQENEINDLIEYWKREFKDKHLNAVTWDPT